MKCPHCKEVDLRQVLTTQGVIVDYCPKCKGIWLDKGEIYYFTGTPTYLHAKIEEAKKKSRPSERLNPRTNTPLEELPLFEGKFLIDYCPETGGIWLDKGEIKRLPEAKKIKIKLEFDKNTYPEGPKKETPVVPLPNLGLVSAVTLFLLYALLTIILITLVNFGVFSAGFAIIIGIIIAALQFLISPFLMDLCLRWFYRVRWTALSELPEHSIEFLQDICKKNKIKIPRMGVIPDGSPNAFTYGHTPNNARVVITSGIMDLLEPKELEGVLAHEIGHVVHWDMLIMTIAYLVPLILYYIFRMLIRMKSSGRDKSAGYRYIIALASYILYIISEYIVLWFSRVREYFADRFSGDATNNPNGLASALVKIGYGLAGKEKKKKDDRNPGLESVKAMGIFDPTSARALAVSSYHPQSMGGEVDKETLQGAMKWDIWNPWAMYYELHSTHPLIAKRLNALSRHSEALGKEPYIRFVEIKPESYWDEFFVDILVAALPLVAILGSVALFGLTKNYLFLKLSVLLLGLAYLGRVFFSYKFSFFPEMNIASLLKKVKVSSIRPVSCQVKGKIIGKGIPGLIWSEDFMLQDETGIIFLDYRQPLALWNFFFGLLRAKRYIAQDVTVTGWFRRAPVPYIELKSLETSTGKSNCFVFNVKIAVSIILIVVGLFLLLVI